MRVPIWLYHVGLGWILGERFLLLGYTGHKSGLLRETVIEVVDNDKASDLYYAASGWGSRSDWFQSIRANPKVKISLGRRRIDACAQPLASQEAAHSLFAYVGQHLIAFHELSILMTGNALHGTEEECKLLAHYVPVIAFHPEIR